MFSLCRAIRTCYQNCVISAVLVTRADGRAIGMVCVHNIVNRTPESSALSLVGSLKVFRNVLSVSCPEATGLTEEMRVCGRFYEGIASVLESQVLDYEGFRQSGAVLSQEQEKGFGCSDSYDVVSCVEG